LHKIQSHCKSATQSAQAQSAHKRVDGHGPACRAGERPLKTRFPVELIHFSAIAGLDPAIHLFDEKDGPAGHQGVLRPSSTGYARG
jgi:hypothetical protein